MPGKRVGYARVSTTDQNPDRQLDGISLDKKFIDYSSGANAERPNLIAMMDYVREDDVILVHSMDRLARNTKDLLCIIETLIKKNVEIQFLKENLIFNGNESSISKLLLMVLGWMSEFELERLKERQAFGIQKAKAEGRYKGKPTKLTEEKKNLLLERIKTRDSKSKIAKTLGVSRFSVYRYLKILGIEC